MKYRSIIKSIFILIALIIMGYYFYKNWSTLRAYQWQLDIKLILLSFILLWLAISSYIFVIKHILKKLTGNNIKFSQMYRIINITNIGRYLPGKIWNILGFYIYISEYGVNKKHAFLTLVASEVTSKGGALILGLCYFIFSSRFESYLPCMVVLLIVCLVVMHPQILNLILNYILKLLRKQQIDINISYSNMLVFLLMFIGVWLLHSLAFYYLINSIASIESIDFAKFATILPLCWVVGYIMIFAPGGIGVREGMLTLTLSEFLSPEVALTIAIIQRIWFIIIEGLNFLISLAIQPETDL